MRPHVLVLIHNDFVVRYIRVLPLIRLLQRSLQSVRLRDAARIAEHVVDLPLLDSLQKPRLDRLVPVALFEHDLVLVLILRVQRYQAKVIVIRQALVKFDHVLHRLVLVDDTVELVVDYEDDTLL